MTKSSLKYIQRRSSGFELEDLSSPKDLSRSSILGIADKLLFQRPFASFSFLILCIALPISIYLALRREQDIIRSEADSSAMGLITNEIRNLVPDKEYTHEFEVTARNIESLQFVDILSPDWFVKGSEVSSGSPDTYQYKSVIYQGTPSTNTESKFALLVKGGRGSESLDCLGCDRDREYLYALSEFNLTSKNCEAQKIWGRNPVGLSNSNDIYSYCEEFENQCLVPSSWKTFNSQDECRNSLNPPEFGEFITDQIITFKVECDGTYNEEILSFDGDVEAKDVDGDIVRFSINSAQDFVAVNQDSTESIVKRISKGSSLNYSDHTYSASLLGDIRSELVGTSRPVLVSACDVLGKCASRLFQVHVVGRSACEYLLPETGNIDVSLTFPTSGSEVRGIDDIVWQMGGAGYYDLELKLYRENCGRSQSFIKDIARFERLNLGESKGYVVGWDTRNYEDGGYCLLILTRDAESDPSGSNWSPSSNVSFFVRNDNLNPVITSSPSKNHLVTGETFQYKVEAYDPDGDLLSYDVIGLPNWLSFDNQNFFGSTTIPGTYNFVVFVDDNHTGYATQSITLNVTPPANSLTNIKFIFPVLNSVLRGGSNNVKWEASDNEGISLIKLYYSKVDGVWNLIGSYPSNATEANWDVSLLENGKYLLRLVVTDGSPQKVESGQNSEIFYISNESKDGEQSSDGEQEGEVAGEDTSMPAINNLAPKPDSQIYSQRPLISASLHPSEGAEIIMEEVKILLDEEEITSRCEISKEEISCQSEVDLDYGRHKVRIEVVDSKDKEMVEEWYFTINEFDHGVVSEEGQVEEFISIPLIDKSISKSAFLIVGLLCIAAFLLVLIPWLIYFIWSRRGRGKVDYSSSQYLSQSPQPTPPYSYPQEGATYPYSSEQVNEEKGFYTPSVYPQEPTSEQQKSSL